MSLPTVPLSQPAAPKEWYSVPEVAQLLGVSRVTAQRMIRDADIQVLRLQRKIRVRRRDVQALLNRHMTTL